MIFEDRKEAGFLLSSKLVSFKNKNSIVMAIPRGGVVVGKAVAEKFNLPLDIIVVRKIGALTNPELAIGAMGPEKTIYLDQPLIKKLGITKSQVYDLQSTIYNEQKEREERLRGEKPYDIKDKTVILVDDGVATGATAIAASIFLRKKQAGKIILATPVIASDTLLNINKYFDKVIALSSEENFYAVGQFYKEFPQIEDEEVIRILNPRSAG